MAVPPLLVPWVGLTALNLSIDVAKESDQRVRKLLDARALSSWAAFSVRGHKSCVIWSQFHHDSFLHLAHNTMVLGAHYHHSESITLL